MNRRIIVALASFFLLTGIVAHQALGALGNQGPAGGKGPPPDAIDACKEKSKGAAVELIDKYDIFASNH